MVKTFKNLLSERGIDESKVMVRSSSHLGGHKYAGTKVSSLFFVLLDSRLMDVCNGNRSRGHLSSR